MFNGKKTYIVSLGVILAAVGGYLTGEMTLAETVTTALAGLGLGTLRMGVAKGPNS